MQQMNYIVVAKFLDFGLRKLLQLDGVFENLWIRSIVMFGILEHKR